MSWLRASRKVVDPSGVKWDVYVTRIHVADPGRVIEPPEQLDYSRAWLVGLVMTIASELARLVVRVLVVLPFALVRSRLGITRQIEAISDWPEEVVRTWLVEGPPAKLLLDEIARGLALGRVPEPSGARYLGERAR